MQNEIWKDVVGYETLFSVSNLGNVRSKRTNRILKQHLNKQGRFAIATKIGGRKGLDLCFKVHRLVATAFIPNPNNKPTVNHTDGNKINNCADNLEWATHSENIQHAWDNGLIVPRTGPLSLTHEQILFIQQNYVPYSRKYGSRALSRMMNVAHTTILDYV